ncbi:unnamed protein product, partial [Brassica rapa]
SPRGLKSPEQIHGKGQHAESKDQPKSPKQSTGRVSVLSPRTNMLICVLTDTHRRPVCADGHTQTSCVDFLCVLVDTHRHHVCADGHTRTATDVLCVLNRQPTSANFTRTVHGKGQRADPLRPKSPKQSTGRVSVLSPRTNVLICVLMDSHRPTNVLCVLTNTHGRPVCADGHPHTSYTATDVLCVVADTWAKITQTVHGKG